MEGTLPDEYSSNSKNFTSHIVNMEGLKFLKLSTLLKVYFTSHIVNMEGQVPTEFYAYIPLFTSHIVNMEGRKTS